MNFHRPKKIVFVGSDTKLLKEWGRENETEVVSSVSFLLSLGSRFIPDLIVFLKLQDADINEIRKKEELSHSLILVVQENFKDLDNLSFISDFQRVLICNEDVALEKDFYEQLMLLMEGKKKCLPSKTASIVKYTILYINKNYSKKLTRKDLSSQVGVTTDYLTRIFNQEMGIPLWTYLNLVRLHFAKDQLEKTGVPVKQIAKNCGFQSAAYFTNCFRELYGTSPVTFRE